MNRNDFYTVLVILVGLWLLVLACCSCRSSRTVETLHTDSLRVVSQAAQRHGSRVADSLSVRDTVKTAIEQRGDTVKVTNTVVRWRDRVVVRTDTVVETRIDTLVKYRERKRSEMNMKPQYNDSRFRGLIICVLLFTSILTFICYLALRYKKNT